jgi:phosphoenolpyruvate---glycerone phosphotransferase subunit DhaL
MDESGRLTSTEVAGWIARFAAAITENRGYLTELDSAIGDADHGANMDRGMAAAVARLNALPGEDVAAALRAVGSALISTVGGASGPLYGTLFLQFGAAAAGREPYTLADWAAGLGAGIAGIVRLGKAEPGDKTMLDALLPASRALASAIEGGVPPQDAIRLAAAAAEDGMRATIPLVARKGRASYLGERSAGHQDPGATSAAILIRAAADEWARTADGR